MIYDKELAGFYLPAITKIDTGRFHNLKKKQTLKFTISTLNIYQSLASSDFGKKNTTRHSDVEERESSDVTLKRGTSECGLEKKDLEKELSFLPYSHTTKKRHLKST